jgi:hypothetical protein
MRSLVAVTTVALTLAGCNFPAFVVENRAGATPAEVQDIALRLEGEAARFMLMYPQAHRPPRGLVCVLLAQEDFVAYGARADDVDVSWAVGYYAPRSNHLVITRGTDPRTISHELAHMMSYNTGIQSRMRASPFWFTEGLATDFENTPEIYRARLEHGRRIPEAQFLRMTGPPPSGISDAYAQAWDYFHNHLTPWPSHGTMNRLWASN